MNDQLTHTQKIKLGDKHARAVPMKSPALGEQYWNGIQDEPTPPEKTDAKSWLMVAALLLACAVSMYGVLYFCFGIGG